MSGKDKKAALSALQSLVDQHTSVSIKKTKNGYECTVFKIGIDHSHYEDDEMIGAIMTAVSKNDPKSKDNQ